MVITKVGETPVNLSLLQPGDVWTRPCIPYDIMSIDDMVGHGLWPELSRFLRKNRIKHKCFITVTRENDNAVSRYYLRIPDDAQAVFFKMHWSDQLSRVSRTG